MKALMLAAVSSLTLAGAAAASDATYELRLDQKNGERTISVANDLNGAFAVAAGREALDLLEGEEADAALKRLRAGPEIDFHHEDADPEHDASGKRKIVIHKMDYDEDETGDSEKREVRIIKRREIDVQSGDGEGVEDGLEAEDDMDLDLADDTGSMSERRIISINAAGKAAATKFIDRIKGLDDAEKAAMKEAVGL
ncbi:MAG: hypothetical protein AAB227_00890 [Pseudomonadota bacterium]